MLTPELLMPAGDMQRLKYALAYGADAVYAGVPRYSLRTRENGFSEKNIQEAIDYTHSQGRKIYLAMNIFPHNTKVDGMLDAFCRFADYRPDAFIVTDIGIIAKMRKLRPDAVIHLSTQANATNWAAVSFYQDLGIKRVIIPRELSLKEIQQIKEKVPEMELEAFVHGSMCMAYSGRCLISNYLTHRDSNQGNCANSCRWQYKLASNKGSLKIIEDEMAPSESPVEAPSEYKELEGEYFISEKDRPDQVFPLDEDENGTYFFNSKDLCAIEILNELRDAGIESFKVEGRTKSLYYASIVSRAYRRALDDLTAGKPFNAENLHELIGTSNRSLMTGFFHRRPEEYGQNYEDGGSKPLTHVFVGHVQRYDAETKMAWIEFRNPVCVGETIEWLTPHGEVSQKVDMILDARNSPKQRISGGIIGGMRAPDNLNPFTILRKRFDPELGPHKSPVFDVAQQVSLSAG